MIDVPSNHPMSTEFAVGRFFIPKITKGWAVFMDSDMLVRGDLGRVFNYADPEKAVMVVKQTHEVSHDTKMDGQKQSNYPRKNWSSFILWNCDHPAHDALTLEYLNHERGLHLHQFKWLQDDLIGELPPEYNWIEGVSGHENPIVVHYTEGGPWFRDYQDVAYAQAWRDELNRWAE